MALTLRTNGTGGGIVSAAWWNDYYDLMTGTMTDQVVTLNYRPGTNDGNASLKLKGDGNVPLLKGYDTNSSTITSTLDHSGNLTLSGTVVSAVMAAQPTAVPASTTSYLYTKVNGESSGRSSLGIRSDGSGNLRFGNNGTSYQTEMYTDGTNIVVSTGIVGPAAAVIPMTRNNAANAAVLFTGTSTPTVGTAPTGSVWVKA